ncbi:hypothetical protein NA56DRAFT_656189 [Hyaloscypha hepaticicola]|uniref:Bacteriophage T5 Orf172 DNA-binding domain-containing protein n=1 Tax=Hyaloscypha hepaticicola TaxID=2082293 RepID=A0A2J6QDZ0_9HELO|nr:hypothetical protein NA56DRAFT_656189 [Hyaloscypha hepaticicola]
MATCQTAASPTSTSSSDSTFSSVLGSSLTSLVDAPRLEICSPFDVKRVALTKNGNSFPLPFNQKFSTTDSNPPVTNNSRTNTKPEAPFPDSLENSTGLEGLMQATTPEKPSRPSKARRRNRRRQGKPGDKDSDSRIGSEHLDRTYRGTPASPPALNANLESNEAWAIPVLEAKHKEYKDENGLKNEILRVMLRRGIAKSPNLDHGYVYIFWSPAFPGHVKIGSTKQAPAQRITQWQTKCEFKCIHVTDINDKSFKHYRIVEALVHAELWNRRRKMYCSKCKSGHRLALTKGGKGQRTGSAGHSEWFEISWEEALEVVNKWRNWVILEKPYGDDATLRSPWKWKHDLGTRMSGALVEWEEWRQFSLLDATLCCENFLEWWMGKVFPPLREIVDTSGSKSAIAAVTLLLISGGTFPNFIVVAIFYFLYKYYCFRHR